MTNNYSNIFSLNRFKMIRNKLFEVKDLSINQFMKTNNEKLEILDYGHVTRYILEALALATIFVVNVNAAI